MATSAPSPPIDTAIIERLRADTVGCRSRIYLDNAGTALMPRPVLDAVQQHLELEAELGGHEAATARRDEIAASRRDLASLIGARAHNVAFTDHATTAWQRVFASFAWQPGQVVITSRHDDVSNQLALLSLAKRFGVEILFAPDTKSGHIDVGTLEVMIEQKRPALVAIGHVPSHRGIVQPVVEIGTLCRRFEVPYLVDARQSLGQIPLDVSRLGCDFLTASGHAFLRGPRGTGLLYVADRVLATDRAPLLQDVGGAIWTRYDTFEIEPSARRFEHDDLPWALILGLGAAARYAQLHDVAALEARLRSLATRIREAFDDSNAIHVLDREPLDREPLDRDPRSAAIVTMTVHGFAAEDLRDALRGARIHASVIRRSDAMVDFMGAEFTWALRVSPHAYNTENEIDSFAAQLTELTGESR
ncbi:MAG: aminotransferase class V-fold PLP-dependent enzyme [Acidobacteriota bacterium]